MAMKNMRRGMPSLFKSGTKHMQGVDEAVMKNIDACKQLAKITASSFGPNGMNKMVINHLEQLFVTNDAATIIREMEVMHPAAKMMVIAAAQQEREVGDGSNFVVVLCGELLSLSAGLLKMGLHPADVIRGYTLAVDKALEYLEELTVVTETDFYSEAALAKACSSAVAAKQFEFKELISRLVGQACAAVMPLKNPQSFNVDNVRVVKVMGSSIGRSTVIKGAVINRPVESTVHSVADAKVAIFNETIDAASTETKGTVLLKSGEELINYNMGEENMIAQQIQAIADCGAKVVVCGGKISDLAKHFIEKHEMMLLRVNSKFDLRRLAKTLGARIKLTLDGIRPDDLGSCSRAYMHEVGGDKVTVFEHDRKDSPIATILLRGGTTSFLNDMERAVDDGVNVIRALVRDPRFVPGGGATEIELASRLSSFADRCSGLEQYAVKKFAEALEVFPRMLASNAGLVSTEIISKLYAAHERGGIACGVNIEIGDVGEMFAANMKGSSVGDCEVCVLDSLPVKASALRLAADTATTVLRVDQIIMAKPAGGPKVPQKKGHWDEDDE